MIGLPSPSHPTVRSVFPNTAVRQSSSRTMRRFRHVFEPAAADVHESHGIQPAVWESFPPKTPALTSLGQIPAKADVDETLKPPECLAGVRVPEVVCPSQHNRIYHRHEFFRADRRSPRREVFQPVPNLLLGGLRRENVDGVLAATGAFPFHEVEADELKSIGQSCPTGLFAVEG